MGITDFRIPCSRFGSEKKISAFLEQDEVQPYKRREKTIEPIITYERLEKNIKKTQYFPKYSTQQQDLLKHGFKRLAYYYDVLTQMRIKRMGKKSKWSATQQTVHKKMSMISLPAFFGQQIFKQNEAAVLMLLNMKTTPDHCCITMARRCGKSESTASGAAALLICVAIAIILCAHRKRAAKLFATTLKGYLKTTTEGKEMLKSGKDNQEEIELTTPVDEEECLERIAHILPGSPEGGMFFFGFIFFVKLTFSPSVLIHKKTCETKISQVFFSLKISYRFFHFITQSQLNSFSMLKLDENSCNIFKNKIIFPTMESLPLFLQEKPDLALKFMFEIFSKPHCKTKQELEQKLEKYGYSMFCNEKSLQNLYRINDDFECLTFLYLDVCIFFFQRHNEETIPNFQNIAKVGGILQNMNSLLSNSISLNMVMIAVLLAPGIQNTVLINFFENFPKLHPRIPKQTISVDEEQSHKLKNLFEYLFFSNNPCTFKN